MNKINYRIILDAHKGGIQKVLRGFFAGDVASRRISVNLSAGGASFAFSDGMQAIMYVTKGNGVTNYGECEIVDNTVVYDVLQADTDVAGTVEMQLKVFNDDMVLYSPMFALEVQDAKNSDTEAEASQHFTALEKALIKAQNVYDARLVSIEIRDDMMFVAAYADGTTYESDAFKDLFSFCTQEEVNKWLEEHPEATTTVQDNSIGMEKFTKQTQLKVVKDYVTPQMFGAKADGVTDDSEAFQLAINSGKDVYVPLTNGEVYAINNKVYVNVFGIKIYGDACKKNVYGFSSLGTILLNVDYAFECVSGVCFEGLTFSGSTTLPLNTGKRTRQGLLLNEDVEGGCDTHVSDCSFFDFENAITAHGRGLEVFNCQFTWVINCVNHNYTFNGENGSSGQQPTTGDRGFRFIKNRMHGIDYCVLVNSGYLTGALFADNLGDVGGGLIKVKNDASIVHSIIKGNSFQQNNRFLILFQSTGVFNNNIIDSNQLCGGDDKYPTSFLAFQDGITKFANNIISDNFFSGCTGNGIDVRCKMEFCSITGNAFVDCCSGESDIYVAVVRAKGLSFCSVSGNIASIIGSAQYFVNVRSSSEIIEGTIISSNATNATNICATVASGMKDNTIQEM